MSDLLIQDEITRAGLAKFNAMNGIKEAEPVKTPLLQNVYRLKGTVNAARNELKLSGADKFKLDKLNAEITRAARDDLKELLAAERDRVSKEADRVVRAYNRDLETNTAKYERQARQAALRYEAMSETELYGEYDRFIANPEPMPPEQIDSLSRAVKLLDPKRHQTMRDAIRAEHRYEGWRFTDDGQTVTKAAGLLDAAMKDGDRVPILLEDGSYRVEALSDIIGGIV